MENQSLNSNPIGWDAKYFRTDGYVKDAVYPVVTVISSKDELEQYHEAYKDKYDFSKRLNGYIDSSAGFLDAMENYSDAFFAKSFLVFILVEEGSGSVRHQVDSVEENGGIVISRLLPEMGTADMAQWHIIVEFDNSFKQERFNTILIDKSIKCR